LPYDKCRTLIFVKVPFPDEGDMQVKARIAKEGRYWYNIQVMRSIVQGCGRAIRAVDDWCKTYILDSDFIWFYKQYSNMFPKWFREAVFIKVRK
jgi:Rad3-related DNA helicase